MLEKFNAAARSYCTWAESPPISQEQDVIDALHHLTTIYGLALTIPDLFGEEDEPELGDLETKRVMQRLSNFPFDYYAVCFNPLDLEETRVIGSISDDLGDIWLDLRRGIDLYNEGHHSSAAWHWRFHFLNHWGRHAVSAISALHAWLAENQVAMPSN